MRQLKGAVRYRFRAVPWRHERGIPSVPAAALDPCCATQSPRKQVKGLEVDTLSITHIQVNKALKQRRRTYRAHGRINPYMSAPCHVELTLTEKDSQVAKEAEDVKERKKSKKELAKLRSGAASKST